MRLAQVVVFLTMESANGPMLMWSAFLVSLSAG